MKKYLLIATALAFTMCCKKTETNSLDAELAKLPPITSTGANTFGCLVNGKAFVPCGDNGILPNYRLDIDPSLDSGVFLLNVYCLQNSNKSQINLGSTVIKKVGIYKISQTLKTKVDLEINNCFALNLDSTYQEGTLRITNYDLSNKIFSGEFDFKFYHKTCNDTVYIKNGRFDKKL